MSIFGTIMSAIFGQRGGSPASQTPAAPGGSSPSIAPGSPSGQAPVDVEAVLNKRAAEKKEKLNWRTSIVDLMKLLDLDSSLNARKELAQELGYTGQLNGSAEMNIWLHKKVMEKMMASGGTVPADLK